MNKQIYLNLIKTVNEKSSHVSELKALGDLFSTMADYEESRKEDYELAEELFIICRTTQNARYDYKLFTLSKYQNRDNHIDVVLAKQ